MNAAAATLLIFLLVYAGMFAGRWPGLALDRTGFALLGAVALLVFGLVTPGAAWGAIDVPTMLLLVGLMIVSGQLRLSGFYAHLAWRLSHSPLPPDRLLGLLILVSGVLSAVIGNDIICLAMAPVLIDGCARRKLDPLPFLLGLACASNVGSAATLIGNPQNILIGQALHMNFAGYLLDGGVPAALGLVATWWLIRHQFAGQWERETALPELASPAYHGGQTAKGLLIVAGLMACFLFASWPRELACLAAVGLVLISRRTTTHALLATVDWQLAVLFMGLFVVNHGLQAYGWLDYGLHQVRGAGIDLSRPGWSFGAAVVLSNLVSNVPAVMLLLPAAHDASQGAGLALASTLAGNLVIVGSIANIIVVEQARRLGVRISWGQHARTGVPVTLATLAIVGAWLGLRRLF